MPRQNNSARDISGDVTANSNTAAVCATVTSISPPTAPSNIPARSNPWVSISPRSAAWTRWISSFEPSPERLADRTATTDTTPATERLPAMPARGTPASRVNPWVRTSAVTAIRAQPTIATGTGEWPARRRATTNHQIIHAAAPSPTIARSPRHPATAAEATAIRPIPA